MKLKYVLLIKVVTLLAIKACVFVMPMSLLYAKAQGVELFDVNVGNMVTYYIDLCKVEKELGYAFISVFVAYILFCVYIIVDAIKGHGKEVKR